MFKKTLRHWLWSPEWIFVALVALLHLLTPWEGLPFWVLLLAQYCIVIVSVIVGAHLIPDEVDRAEIIALPLRLQAILKWLVRQQFIGVGLYLLGIPLLFMLGKSMFVDMYVVWSCVGGAIAAKHNYQGWAKIRRRLRST